MADAGMLKQINLQKIRDAFLMGGPFSKTELAEKTGLSFPTVGKIVDEMVAARQLQIAGTGSSSGGRCSRIYQYNADYRNAIAMILEGQNLDWFILDSLGMTKSQGRIEIDSDLFDTLVGLLLQAAVRNLRCAASVWTSPPIPTVKLSSKVLNIPSSKE